VELLGGTMTAPVVYRGSSAMINPPNGKSGEEERPITVRCSVDGGCLLDGQFERIPVRLTRSNNWWVVEGINAKNGSVQVVRVQGSNNIVRRVVGWDVKFNNTSGDVGAIFSCYTVNRTSGLNNVFEDVAGFGIAQSIFSASQNFRGACTFRRAWGRVEMSPDRDNATVPFFGLAYNSKHHTCENCLSQYQITSEPHQFRVLNATPTVFGQCPPESPGSRTAVCSDGAPPLPGGAGWNIGRFDSKRPQPYDFDMQVLGSISYVLSGSNLSRKLLDAPGRVSCTGTSSALRCAQQYAPTDRLGGNITFKDVLWIVDPAHANFNRSRALRMDRMDTNLPLTLDHVSTIAGTPNEINAYGVKSGTWTQISVVHATSLSGLNTQNANPWTGTRGANLCFQYVNRAKTSTKLWPWPMNDRIKAATSIAGVYGAGYTAAAIGCDAAVSDCQGAFPKRGEVDVTGAIESLLGPIPASCRQ
jgi:hypothetical protein